MGFFYNTMYNSTMRKFGFTEVQITQIIKGADANASPLL